MMNSQNLQLQLRLPVQDLSLRGRSFMSKPTNKVVMHHHQCLASAAASSSSPAATARRGLQVVPHPSRRRRPRALVAVVRATTGSSDDNDASGGESSSSGGGEEDDDDEKRKYSSNDKEKEGGGGSSSSSSLSREDLERLVGTDDDAKFNGLDLANLIRKKYGRSYDVTLIKKVYACRARPMIEYSIFFSVLHSSYPVVYCAWEFYSSLPCIILKIYICNSMCIRLQEFMGRNLLAMNVMWKYREQVSIRSSS